jgi:hypothetical protein
MKLPSGDQAVIDERKLWGYTLNPRHPHGRQHAHLFKSLLGIDLSNWQTLKRELARAAREDEATEGKKSGYGRR